MDEDHVDCKSKSKFNQAGGGDEKSSSSSSSSGRDDLDTDERPCSSKVKNDGVDHQVIGVDITLEENSGAGIEKVCRICHLSNEQSSSRSPELVQLGCDCKEELGLSHRHCAEAWFKHKGNRVCEICNKIVKNVKFAKEPRLFVVEINQLRTMGYATGTSSPFDSLPMTESSPRQSGSRRCKQSCNFLLGCLVLAFLISTFVRVKLL